ncbi:MAG: TonB-dependent siderophore receptor [Sphingopyxis sp.]|nr:TonB-dependent siderophore receptor [Sphingopyxis sp.]
MKIVAVVTAGLLAGVSLPALAVEAALDAGEYDGREIIVTGTLDGYRTIDTTTGTKTNTPIIDVPQSITIVTSEQLDDQAIRSMTDLARLVPGVSAGQGEGHRDQLTFRGNNSTADFFVDGLRDDVQYYRGFYNIERVEVHKGPNAMVSGRGGGGGLINRISKGALVGENRVEATASVDTFGAWYLAADVNAQLGAGAGLRINAFYEALDNHRDAFSGERYAVNPVVGAELSDSVKVELGYEHVRDDRVVDRGVPGAFVGTLTTPTGPPTGLRDAFFGVRGTNDTDFEAHVLRFRGEAELNDQLTLTAQALYGDYDKVYSNVYPASAINRSGATPTLAIEAYSDPTQRESFIAQSNLVWRGATGPLEHVLLFGAEFTTQDTYNERINGFFGGGVAAANRRVDIPLSANPVIPAPVFVAGPTGNGNRAVSSDLSQVSLYVQDQISIGEAVELIAGLRYDRFDLTAVNEFTRATFARVDDLWSPRVGLVFKPAPNASVYVSYAKSFLPQSGDQFVNLDLTSAALKPESFDNYELGVKWDVTPGLSLTAAAFQLDRGNTRAPGAVAGTVVLTGEQRSKGFEFGLTGKVTPIWQVAAGYSYTDAEITATTSAAPVGRRVGQVPRHQLNWWNRIEVNDMLGVGLGVFHQSKSFATISNVAVIPAYTRVDAALFAKLGDRVDAQINVENLLGERYFPFAHNDNNFSTGAPRNARVTVRVKF